MFGFLFKITKNGNFPILGATCGWQLTLTNYKALDDEIYCKHHFPVVSFHSLPSSLFTSFPSLVLPFQFFYPLLLPSLFSPLSSISPFVSSPYSNLSRVTLYNFADFFCTPLFPLTPFISSFSFVSYFRFVHFHC